MRGETAAVKSTHSDFFIGILALVIAAAITKWQTSPPASGRDVIDIESVPLSHKHCPPSKHYDKNPDKAQHQNVGGPPTDC